MKCNHCEGKTEIYLTAKDRFSNIEYKLYKCQLCDFIQTGIGPNGSVKNFYPNIYYKSNFNKIRLYLSFRRFRANFIRKLRSPGNILDIGCGTCTMLYFLKKHGWIVYGTEISETSAQLAKKTLSIEPIVTDGGANLPIEVQSLDAISMWHVGEHIANLGTYLKNISKYLKKDGLLIIEVPNINSLQFRVFKSKWYHLDVPRHLNHFTINTLMDILRKNGYEVISTKTFSIEYGPEGWAKSIQKNINFIDNKTYSGMFIYLALLVLFLPFEYIVSLFSRGAVINIVAHKK